MRAPPRVASDGVAANVAADRGLRIVHLEDPVPALILISWRSPCGCEFDDELVGDELLLHRLVFACSPAHLERYELEVLQAAALDAGDDAAGELVSSKSTARSNH